MIEGDEVCDGTAVGGASCAALGFTLGGSVGCTADCSRLDVSGCTASFVVPDVGLSFEAPAIDSTGRIYAAGFDVIVAIDPDGTEVWRLPGDGEVAVYSDERVMRTLDNGSSDASVEALDRGGNTIWSYTITRDDIGGMAIGADGTTYVAGYTGFTDTFDRLYAIDPNGALAWSYGVSALYGPIIADDGTLYVASQSSIAKLSPDGTLLDTLSCPGLTQRSRLIMGDDGTLYFVAGEGSCDAGDLGTVAAISPQGGCLWSTQFVMPQQCSWVDVDLVMGNEAIYAFMGSRLVAVDTAGAVLWQVQLSFLPKSIVLSDAGDIFVGGIGGDLEAFSPDGTLLWKRTGVGTVHNMTFGLNDTLYMMAYPDLVALPIDRGLPTSGWPRSGRDLRNSYGQEQDLCGNGQIEPLEVCDGALLGGASCDGTLQCAPDCLAYDTSQCADILIFSEYVEGSGNNKALEIANLDPGPVDLSTCSIERYTNGATTPSAIYDLPSQSLASGDVIVICHTSADPALLDFCDLQSSAATNFNGDDALVLRCSGQVKDSFGKVGEDPGSAWGSGDTVTVERTLRRKASVILGDTIPDDAFDPAAQWDSYPTDTFSGLGTY